MSLCTTAGAGDLLYMKSASNRNLMQILPLQLNLPYFIEEFQSADLQLLSRPHTFRNYFWTPNEALVLKHYQFLFKYNHPILAMNVDYSHKICHSVCPTNNKHTG